MSVRVTMKLNFSKILSRIYHEQVCKAPLQKGFSFSNNKFSTKTSLVDACTIEDGGSPITENPQYENRRIRRNLALAYRLLNRLELNEGVCNHLTAMAPCRQNNSKQTMLVIPGKGISKTCNCKF